MSLAEDTGAVKAAVLWTSRNNIITTFLQPKEDAIASSS